MDIGTQAEIYLREAGYDTWAWTGASPPVTCFENPALVGFLHVFATAADLLAQWEEAQRRVLSRHAAPLRLAGAKAWNVYSVFLTSEKSPELQTRIERLEENFTLTRKITRTGVQTIEDLAHALMPLAPIKAQPLLENADMADRVRSRAKDVPGPALAAFLGSPTPEEVAEILGSRS
jgi:hypothetical protein